MTMKRAAIIAAGTVANLVKVDPAALPEIDGLHLVPDGVPVAIGWAFDGTVFTPPAAAAPTVTELKARAAARRWAAETGGITVDGAAIDTSRESQAMIAGAHAYAAAVLSATVDFKASAGWVTLDAAAITGIALAVGAHVQACFAVERQVDAAIDAGTLTTFAEIEAAAWPSNGG